MRNRIGISTLVLLMAACNSKKDYKEILHDPVLFANTVHELNGVVMGNNFSPIVASRNYLYAAVAAYEVIAAGYPHSYRSLAGQVHGLNHLPAAAKGVKIDYELAGLFAYCTLGEAVTFPAGSMRDYTDSLNQLAREHGMSQEELDNSIAFADTISAAILQWSKKDNYAETRSFQKYTVLDTPGRWVPTPPAYSDAAEPHWIKIRPLVLDSANQFLPPPPPAFDMKDRTSKYYQEVILIKKAGDSLSTEQKHIAEFWDDNPFKLNVSGHVMFSTKKFSPPGHWMGIVGIAAKKAKADFAATVYAYAISSIALFDSFIQCWDEKYRHNTVRPETVINRYLDPEWRPYLQTPPFPEYTCGHSTVSAATAEALTYVFGDNFAYTDTTELEFGIPNRRFKSFRDAAIENNRARFYGGIHFHNSCIISTEYGKMVGALVVKKLKMRTSK